MIKYSTYLYTPAPESGEKTELYTLGVPGRVGHWFFDISETKETEMSDWDNTLTEIDFILNLGTDYFGINAVEISIDNLGDYAGFNKELTRKIKKENVRTFLADFIKNKDVDYPEISIACLGYCTVEKHKKVYCELFKLIIKKDHGLSVSILTNNICFLPHNPLLGIQQYSTWADNGVKMAKIIRQFNDFTKSELTNQTGERFEEGAISENVYFLRNLFIADLADPETDEFHVPFELLAKEDYAFFFGGNS